MVNPDTVVARVIINGQEWLRKDYGNGEVYFCKGVDGIEMAFCPMVLSMILASTGLFSEFEADLIKRAYDRGPSTKITI